MKLYQHQIDAADFITARGGVGALFMDCGTGKTITALEIFKRMRRMCPSLTLTVIAPLSLLESAWREDAAKYGFDVHNAHDDGVPDHVEDVLVANYEMLLNKKYLYPLIHHIRGGMLVIDESSRMKGFKTQTTKVLLSLEHLPRFKIIMSGTPAPNSPAEYWAQMEFLKPQILHKSFYGFRNTYFHLARNGQVMALRGQVMTKELAREVLSKGWKYDITTENMAAMMQKIEPLIFRAKKDECLDLPEQVDEVRQVAMGQAQAALYRSMKKDLLVEIGKEFIAAPIALAKLMKLREIASSFCITAEGKEVSAGEQTKMRELMQTIEEVGNQPLIIWAAFQYDIRAIAEKLIEAFGEDCCRTLYSETRDREESIQAFKMGKARFLIAHPASAAHGLTFTNCSTQIFYSMDYSLERYLQARDRLHRIGQVNHCTYIHILARGTIDENIYAILKKKGEMNALLDDFRNQAQRKSVSHAA